MQKFQMSLFGGEPEEILTPEEIIKRGLPFNPLSPKIVSYGGGQNSTAMLIVCALLGIKIDLILFADTGGEKKETYAYLETFNKWLVAYNMPEITCVRHKQESKLETNKGVAIARQLLNFAFKCKSSKLTLFIWWVSVVSTPPETLEEECLRGQGLPSKAYGRSGCSDKWKIRPQLAFEKNWQKGIEAIKAGVPIIKMIGYHSKEMYRLIDKRTGKIRPFLQGNYQFDHPLIRWGFDNHDCKRIILSVGLPLPPKSSCFFCPSMQVNEILNLDPETLARAHLIEQCAADGIYARQNTSTYGLGRSIAWRDIGKMGELEKALFDMKLESRQCNCIEDE